MFQIGRLSAIALIAFWSLLLPTLACAGENVDAYVQSYDEKVVRNSQGIAYGLEFTAQVKIRKTGTYTLRGGYWKNGNWHVGGIVGTLYYNDGVFRGDAGDTVFVKVICYNRPPWNKSVACLVLP